MNLDAIRAAARRLDGRVLRTPLRPSAWLTAATGGDVRLKLETRQPTSSYKVRGAFNAVLRLLEEQDAPPALVTASAGNHGRALAWAAQSAGIPLTVYVPEDAPRTKVEAIRESKAALRACRNYDEAERRAKEHGASGDALYISPYSHPDVIAGAGTVGLEVLEDWPDVETIVVPIGGGGLISGTAIAARALSSAAVVGVEVAASSPFTRGLAAGHIVEIDVLPTLADSLAGNLDPETVTFAIVGHDVARIAVVTEDELRTAIAGTLKHEREVVEGAGAVGVAALLAGKLDVRDQRVAVILSGANIDQDKLSAIVVSSA